jgi:hypothetical protein
MAGRQKKKERAPNTNSGATASGAREDNATGDDDDAPRNIGRMPTNGVLSETSSILTTRLQLRRLPELGSNTLALDLKSNML